MTKYRTNIRPTAATFMATLAASLALPLCAQASPPFAGLDPQPQALAQLGMPVTSPPVVAPKPATNSQLMTLRSAIKAGKASMKIKGDGVTTSSVRMQLTNKTNQPLKVVVPANEILTPNVGGVQTMMVIADVFITIEVGQTTIITVPTVCASVKTVPPPPADGVEFAAGNYGDPIIWKQLSGILAAAKEIDKSGGYKGIPMSGSAKDQIAQLAVWRVWV